MGTNHKIKLEQWYQELRVLLADAKEIDVHDRPDEYFYGLFCDGLPCGPKYREIWFEEGLVISVENGGRIFKPEARCWNKHEDSSYRIFWLSEEGVFSEVSQETGHLTEFFAVSSPVSPGESKPATDGRFKKIGRASCRERV